MIDHQTNEMGTSKISKPQALFPSLVIMSDQQLSVRLIQINQ